MIPFKTLLVVTVFLFGGTLISLCSSTTGGDIHYVSSKPSSECFFLNVSERQHCKTLDEYASNTSKNSENGTDNMTMMFLPGVHSLTGNFSIEGKLHVTLVGQSSQINQTHIHLHHGGITVQNVAQVNFYNLSINGFSNYTVSLKGVIDVKIEDVVITGSALIYHSMYWLQHCDHLRHSLYRKSISHRLA